MTNPHFLSFDTWREVEDHLGYAPLGRRLAAEPRAFRVHVRDHRLREVEPTLEVHFDGFVLSQALRGHQEARRLATEVRYGPMGKEISVGGHRAIRFELGPEPEPDDPDQRAPAVVTWADGEMFILMASDEIEVEWLVELADSLYR